MPAKSASRFIAVFCGSADGVAPAYREEAARLGGLIARYGWGLVYGGASIGLMAAVADAALAGGAPVVGVLPAVLRDREVAHAGLSELIYVDTMHQRKARMAERADAFIALPGGFGTLDELFEILTWQQLGIHTKPVVLVNTLGYFDGLLRFADHAVEQGFVRPEHRDALQAVPHSEAAMNLLQAELKGVEARSAERSPTPKP